MREIRYTARFKRDYKREKSGRRGKSIEAALMTTVRLLASDRPLRQSNADHALSGEWADHRDCHIRPDLILIYRKPDDTHSRPGPLRLPQRAWFLTPLQLSKNTTWTGGSRDGINSVSKTVFIYAR